MTNHYEDEARKLRSRLLYVAHELLDLMNLHPELAPNLALCLSVADGSFPGLTEVEPASVAVRVRVTS